MLSIPIIAEEVDGIDRIKEPITLGVPFPKDFLTDVSQLTLSCPQDGRLPLQTQVLARWPNQSLKWALLDSQISIEAKSKKELQLYYKRNNKSIISKGAIDECKILISKVQNLLKIDTKAASFFINIHIFKPFDRVTVGGHELLNGALSKIILTDEKGIEYQPLINSISFETKGNLRTTLKIEGKFESSTHLSLAPFFSRLTFFANSSVVKIDFSILNPRAAKHPGGLWDLGDPGSITFKDLSIKIVMDSSTETKINWKTQFNGPMNQTKEANLVIYQDSSGGENWQSHTHVNREGKVKSSFRGYRVYLDGNIIEEDQRANPIISLMCKDKQISGIIKYFWQNFPKAIEASNTSMIIRLFPHQYNDIFELQGGEQKTHTTLLHFSSYLDNGSRLEWIQNPLILRSTPEWYTRTKVFDYLVPENNDPNKGYLNLINVAIKGDNTFFQRREIIDEYGWRHFGELYADHEAIGYEGPETLVSHYNNQYDGIYSALVHYARSGDWRWFVLADNICCHVKDIDIYHTDEDRPEYNRGLFWHTEHYIDSATCTHRCFSKQHLKFRNVAAYGGGPSLSHVYTTGLLYHYYLTGDPSSADAVKELASFVINNIDMEGTICSYLIKKIRNLKEFMKKKFKGDNMAQSNKVYSLDGPGRASGNTLNVLLDAYLLSEDQKYLKRAVDLIMQCISPVDDFKKRNLIDIENRWMYTVFLQALGRYLDLKQIANQIDNHFFYARACLIHYAQWMVDNEYPYLETPDKLEYPNETWAAQEMRKGNIFKYVAKHSESKDIRSVFIEKSRYFFNISMEQLTQFPTRYLTRPIILLMINGHMQSYFDLYFQADENELPGNLNKDIRQNVKAMKDLKIWKVIRSTSLRQEGRWLKRFFS